MRRELVAAAVACALTVGLASGCGAATGTTADPQAPESSSMGGDSSGPAPTEARVDPNALPSLDARLPPLQPVGFAIAGDEGLEAALGTAVSQAAVDDAFVSVYPIGSSADLIGFRIRTSTPTLDPIATRTFWYSIHQRQEIPSQWLLADGAAPAGGVSFTPAGDIYLESVVDGRTQSKAADSSALSELGEMAQSAALQPTDPAQPEQVDCSVKRCIALTFDDGPSDYTPALRKTLADNGARATFFILGRNLVGREQTLQALAAAGHQIGNHTVNHPRLSEQPQETVVSEIAQAKQALAPYGHNGSELFRPPYGLYNDDVITAASDAGYSVTMWSIDPADYRTTDPEAVVRRVLQEARPGAVVLSHDTLEHTEVAYRTIIPELRKAGYELVTIDQLLGAGAPGQVRRGR